MHLVHLTVSEVTERATMELRVAVCKKCFKRPPGSESLGADVPRTCQPECELFAHLPRLSMAAGCLDPSLCSYERALASMIEEIVSGPNALEAGCPLSRYRRDVIRVLGGVAGG